MLDIIMQRLKFLQGSVLTTEVTKSTESSDSSSSLLVWWRPLHSPRRLTYSNWLSFMNTKYAYYRNDVTLSKIHWCYVYHTLNGTDYFEKHNNGPPPHIPSFVFFLSFMLQLPLSRLIMTFILVTVDEKILLHVCMYLIHYLTCHVFLHGSHLELRYTICLVFLHVFPL